MQTLKSGIVFGIVITIFSVLVLRLFFLQIIESSKYQRASIENAARTVPAIAPRGVIYGRNGEILVENRPVFSAQVLPELLFDEFPAKREKVLEKLGIILGEKITRKFSANQPIIIKDNISLSTALKIEEQKGDLYGVVVNVHPVRFYPHGSLASHLLGYVGEIESDELKRLREEGYRLGDSIGKDGVERNYDKLLRGINGGKKIEVDVYGKPLRLLESLEPVPGADVKLTLDLSLQSAAENAMNGKSGAAIVLDPNTGEILALASRPNFDPNIFINPMDANKWANLSKNRHPFMNRALAIYPPGSIFKVITLSAALEENIAKPTETMNCPGYFRINNRIAKCWKETGHGRITVAEGLTQSCDVVFYELGRRLGPEKIAKFAQKYGLGEKTGIDIPQEKKGIVPTEEWKKQVWKEPWYEGDSINYGIGQGFLQVTPLQMAEVYGMIATGKRMKPFVVAGIKDHEGRSLFQAHLKEEARVPVSKANLDIIRRALFNVVDRATGRAAKVEGIPAAGKTGTAQNPGIPHAWFLCYAPFDNPKIVIASFVEHGEHGDRSAAYVARDILTWYKVNRLQPAQKPPQI